MTVCTQGKESPLKEHKKSKKDGWGGGQRVDSWLLASVGVKSGWIGSIWTCLAPLGLVLDVVNGTDLGSDVLEVRQWLVKDAQLFGCSRRGFWRCADDGHFLLLWQQAEGFGGARSAGGSRSTARVAGRGTRGDGHGPGGAGCGGATAGRAGPSRLCAYSWNRT